MDDGRPLLERYVAAYNDHDHHAVRACFSPDARCAQNGEAGPAGIDGVLAILGARWASYPDCTIEVRDSIEVGDRLVLEWAWSGRHGGPIELDDGRVLAPTGRLVSQLGVDLLIIANGRIIELRGYWDNLAELRQLGVGRPCSVDGKVDAELG